MTNTLPCSPPADDFLEVYNIDHAQHVILQRCEPPSSQAATEQHAAGASGAATAGAAQSLRDEGACSYDDLQRWQQWQQPQERQLEPSTSVKMQYRLMPEAQGLMEGISDEMCRFKPPLDLASALAWRPYWRQVPPPPDECLEHEAALQACMRTGYGEGC